MPIDYADYPPNWKTEIVPAVRRRSGGKCEFCGLKNGQMVWSYKIFLKDNKGRYKLKTFWTESKSDLDRILPYAHTGSIKPVKVVLTVAHLDHDETNMNVSIERLRDLCQYCHLNYDAVEKLRRSMTNHQTKLPI